MNLFIELFQIGDRVFFTSAVSGSYAEYAVCEALRVFRLPARMSFSQGAAIGAPYFTAYRALFIKYF